MSATSVSTRLPLRHMLPVRSVVGLRPGPDARPKPYSSEPIAHQGTNSNAPMSQSASRATPR